MSEEETSALFAAWRGGNRAALDELIPRVEQELRRLARAQLRRERSDHSLSSAALVNEAYLRLIDQRNLQNRAHFVSVAVRMMRRILLNHARDRQATKRGGGAVKVPLNEALDAARHGGGDVVNYITIHDALEKLAKLDERQVRIVELKVFGGLKRAEIAAVLGVSDGTVKRDWAMARAWLRTELGTSD